MTNTVEETCLGISEGWVFSEFGDIDFGDKRLNDRFLQTTSRLAANPVAPINHACHGWHETKAAYRMFANPALDTTEIIKTHAHQTYQRIALGGYKTVFAIQDTSVLDFNGHVTGTSGLGPTGKNPYGKNYGLIFHSCLTVSEDGTPLGFLSQKCWARASTPELTPKERRKQLKKRPIEDKESFKWLECLDDTVNNMPDGVRLITVADREADISEFICKANDLKTGFLIRASHNRRVEALDKQIVYMREHLEAIKLTDRRFLEISSNGEKRKQRMADVEIKFSKVTLSTSERDCKFGKSSTVTLRPVDVYVVEVKEINPPSKKEAIDWLLLSSEPITSFQEAWSAVDQYKLRWNIEIFHKILKSGCTVEACRLDTGLKLIRYITVMSIIAYQIFHLSKLSRSKPSLPCTSVLSESEWKALYFRKFKSKQFPENAPTVAQATTWIAELGGYLNRKSDGPPGPIVLWRGWQVLSSCVEMWETVISLEKDKCG